MSGVSIRFDGLCIKHASLFWCAEINREDKIITGSTEKQRLADRM